MTSKSDDIGAQMKDALNSMGTGSTEIETLIRLIAGAALSGDKDTLSRVAGMQAALTLAGIVLNDLHRIADAQEILAKAVLNRGLMA